MYCQAFHDAYFVQQHQARLVTLDTGIPGATVLR